MKFQLFSFLLLSFSGFAQKAELEYGAYLQQLTSNSVIICWKTTTETIGKVSYGEADYNSSISSAIKAKNHFIKVTNLRPNTIYKYAIGTDAGVLQGTSANYFKTVSAVQDAPIRIWAIGDFGDVGRYRIIQEQVRDAFFKFHQQKNTDVWLWLGDNAYDGTEAKYKDNVFDIYSKTVLHNTPFYSVPGNHEYFSNKDYQKTRAIPYPNLVSQPTKGEMGGVASNDKFYYSFNQSNVHFICLDSYGMELGQYRLSDFQSPQFQWLKKDLEANKQKWTIVTFHHPPYTKRSHNSDGDPELVNIRKFVVPLLEQFKVDLVLNGHSHIYERSYLMKDHVGVSDEFNKTKNVVDANYGTYPKECPIIKKNEGTIYSTVGSSGRLDVNPFATKDPHQSSVYANIIIGGSLMIDIEKNKLEAKWIAQDGKVYDNYTVFKDVNTTKNINLEYGEKVNLTPSWKGKYTWSNGIQNNQSIEVQPLKSINFFVKDSLGCLKDAFNLIVAAQPIVSISSFKWENTACNGSNAEVFVNVENTTLSKWEYKVELSDVNGVFKKPLVLAVSNVNPIKFKMPDTLSASSKYEIRVTPNSNLFINNGTFKLEIFKKPEVSIAGNQTITLDQKATIKLSMKGSSPFQLNLSDGQVIKTDKFTYDWLVKPSSTKSFTAEVSNICGQGITNGKADITVPLLIEENQIENWVIAPNPVNGELFLIKNENHSVQKVGLKIYNSVGTLIHDEVLNPTQITKISLRDNKAGVYLLKIIEKNKVSTKRFILQ